MPPTAPAPSTAILPAMAAPQLGCPHHAGPRSSTSGTGRRGLRRSLRCGRLGIVHARPDPYGDPVDLGLSGRVAVVVGGTGYIGSAIADRLRAEGATVVTASRSGGDVRIDGADDASVEAGVAAVLQEHGR